MPETKTWLALLCATLLPALACCGEASNGETVRQKTITKRDVNPASTTSAVPPDSPQKGPAPPVARTGQSLPSARPAPSALFNAAYQRDEAGWVQVLFLCDGVEGDRVQLITTPDAKGLSILWTYAKPGFRTRREVIRVGRQDVGAGNIWWPLLDDHDRELGAVRSLNPGMVEGGAGLPTLSSIRMNGVDTRCRRIANAQLLVMTPVRTVVVTRENGAYRYRSFDHAKQSVVTEDGAFVSSQPTVSVAGGRLVPAARNHERYEFHNGPWTYRVDASADNRAPGASLTVLKNGRMVQTSTASAYEMAARRIED